MTWFYIIYNDGNLHYKAGIVRNQHGLCKLILPIQYLHFSVFAFQRMSLVILGISRRVSFLGSNTFAVYIIVPHDHTRDILVLMRHYSG